MESWVHSPELTVKNQVQIYSPSPGGGGDRQNPGAHSQLAYLTRARSMEDPFPKHTHTHVCRGGGKERTIDDRTLGIMLLDGRIYVGLINSSKIPSQSLNIAADIYFHFNQVATIQKMNLVIPVQEEITP